MLREYRHIVRVLGTDIEGQRRLINGLTKIKGIGVSFANAIVRAAGLKPDMRFGQLSDSDVQKIESIASDPQRFGIPPRLFNRRKDPESGRDLHLIGSDLMLKVKSDIELMKSIKCWKGVRHSLGLKVRGQRTRTTGRTGKTVGVKKKAAAKPAKSAAS
ncbi:MAG: 30S ribosomal protein S13 [Candidatus Bathyarchaeia archaeon]